MKPYSQIPIVECGEPLVAIPLENFAVESPHPYEKLGAPYEGRSPFYLRRNVVERLLHAQTLLQEQTPDWGIRIFDAYRPVAVQQFMVDYALVELLKQKGLVADELSTEQRRSLLAEVYQFWAPPSLDPATPPPHSTGAAIDVTLADGQGREVDMGSPIDELSERSYPNYFAERSDLDAVLYHTRRQHLAEAMQASGFARHPNEWWHFSYGDQLWAWIVGQPTARYGRV